jgi:hypothetical protein
MTWFAFHGYPTIDEAGAQEKELVAFGFHGYATQAEANAHPNSVNALQKAIVNAAEADYAAALQEQAQPGGANASNPLGAAIQGSGLAPLVDIGQFFHTLREGKTWTRVAEVAVGGILVYAGVRALTSGSTVNRGVRNATSTVTKPVRKTAKSAVKVAVPEVRLARRTAAKRVAPKTTARVAAHRQQVAKYGQKKPYSAPTRTTSRRVTHIYHHKVGPKTP